MKKLVQCIQARLEELHPWLEKDNVEAYRLYDHQLEEFPFVAEVYLDRLHIQLSESSEETTLSSRVLASMFSDEFGFELSSIYVKSRKQQKGKNQYEKVGSRNKKFVVCENGCLFYINLIDYFDTGLFLDHRTARLEIGRLSTNKTVLNLFAYTGSFSVYAAKRGAKKTITVDTSNTYLNWAKENFTLNRITSNQNEFIKKDAIVYLEDAARSQKELFDVIIIDPPTFSNSKSRKKNFEIKRDHVDLINNALEILNENGMILFSTNFRKFKLNEQNINSKNIKDVTDKTTSHDFKDAPFIRYTYQIRK